MRSNTLLKILLLSTLLNFSSIINTAYADTLDTQLSRDKIALGETTVISFTLNGNANAGAPNFSALDKDFTIIDTNYGNSIQMVNGVTTSQTFWRVTVEPKKTGIITIPEINFGNVKSTIQKLEVTQGASQTTTASADSPVFVEASLSETSAYVQSQVIYTFKLYYQSQLESPRVEMPQVTDATFIQLGEGTQYQTSIKGRPFVVVEKNFALFPQKPGEIAIPAARFHGVAFDVRPSMMNNPFYMPSPQRISLQTKTFILDVKSIPDKFQGGTWLPANNISLTDKWSVNPDQWESGNPAIRSITVEAQGLRSDQIPDLTIDKIDGVNEYVDPPKRSNELHNNMVIGKLEQKVTYIPNSTQSFTIPAIKLFWWNLQTNANDLAQLHSQVIQIKAGANSKAENLQAPVASINNSKPAIVNPAITNEMSVKSKTQLFYNSIWFWVAIILFSIWLITMWLFLRKRNATSTAAATKPVTIAPEKKLSYDNFARACTEGDASFAQQFLLSWAKKQWLDIPPNLEKLRDTIDDDHFKNALRGLEQTIYAKKSNPWNGNDLLAAYNKVKNQHKSSQHIPGVQNIQADLLPPLNP
jgi:hypothetical protein